MCGRRAAEPRVVRHTCIYPLLTEPYVSTTSDPFARSVRRPPTGLRRSAPACTRHAVPFLRQAGRGRVAVLARSLGWAVGLCGASLVLANLLASPMQLPAGAPTWNVAVTAAGAAPVAAVVYGRDLGLQLVLVPAAGAGSREARFVPARLARGDVHFLSLGWSPLTVRTTSPDGVPAMTLAARARSVTLFQRVGWTAIRTR